MWKLTKKIALFSLMFGVTAPVATSFSSQPVTITSPTTSPKELKKETLIVQNSVEEKDNFSFELQSCRRSSQKVTCYLLITNTGNEDRNLLLYGSSSRKSRIIDFSGNEYFAEEAQVGRSRSSVGGTTDLIRGIPLKASVRFELPQQITKVAVLELEYNDFVNKKVQFRNVDIVAFK